ncbi:MAG: hypothetical protein GC200_02415 [Tepidisphaera sp.]|nr:hypothetical protein [Tepidisphaera sp.]
MIAVNLLSVERVAAARRRARRRAWAGVLMGHAALAGLTLLVVARLDSPGESSAQQIARLQDQLSQKDRERGVITSEIAALRARIALSDRVTDHPRWGSLLALLSNALAGDGVLDRIEIGSKTSTPIREGKTEKRLRDSYSVTLSGYAGSRAGVARFITRLEAIGVFDSVTPLETRATTYGPNNAEAVSFSLSLSLSEGGKGK